MATPRDQCNQHLACQPRERVVALECHSICKLIFTPRPSRCAYCKLNDVDPESYLRHVPGVIADWPVNRVSELLPWRIALPAE
ncbi:TPA: transposase domain-containing protein [Escherichia coli]